MKRITKTQLKQMVNEAVVKALLKNKAINEARDLPAYNQKRRERYASDEDYRRDILNRERRRQGREEIGKDAPLRKYRKMPRKTEEDIARDCALQDMENEFLLTPEKVPSKYSFDGRVFTSADEKELYDIKYDRLKRRWPGRSEEYYRTQAAISANIQDYRAYCRLHSNAKRDSFERAETIKFLRNGGYRDFENND